MTGSPALTATRADLRVSLGATPGTVRSLLLHPAGGGVTSYLPLAMRLAERGPVDAIRASGLLPGEQPHASVAEMVEAYAAIVDALPEPPNLVVGWSMGGVLAWELAVRLAARGHRPAVVVIDSNVDPSADVAVNPGWRGHLRQLVLDHVATTMGSPTPEVTATVDAHVSATLGHAVTDRYDGPALLLACGEEADVVERLGDWPALGGSLRVERLPGEHFEVFSAAVLPLVIDAVDRFVTETVGGER